jgi:hypothetical protein
VHAAGLKAGQETTINAAMTEAAEELDVLLIDIHVVAPIWAMALNPLRRSEFGSLILSILRDTMRRPKVAKHAADLWNSLE